MSSWAERVHRRAAVFSNAVTSCGHPSSSAPAYPYRLEKVKFGVSLDEVCKNDNIPGPLLVLILKLNKESPNRRDVFRAPGHQGAMKKLIHFLQAGRLVNVDNYSVYTIASVLKKFLRKIPNGIFGRSGEEELFTIIELTNELEQTNRLHKLLQLLPKYTQHLLVLLFGTFRVIASNAAHAGTGMTSEALGVSVAPSFFQSCVSDGRTARMEDVLKFKVATKIMKHIIDKFATHDLFGRENYEYYARVTGRILKVQDEWICSFQYPPPPRGKLAQQKYALQHSLEAEKTWLQCQCERWGLLAQEESRSTPALLTSSSSALDNSIVSLGVTPEHSFMESCARLSVSLEGPALFALTSSPLPKCKYDLPAKYGDDNDIDEDDHNNDGDDDEEHNDNNHLNYQHCQQGDDKEYSKELEISNGSDDGDNNKSIENHSYKANFCTCISSTVSKSRKLKCRSSSSNDRPDDGGSDAGDNIFTYSQEDLDDEITCAVKRRYKQNKKKASSTNTAQIRVQQQQRRFIGKSKTPTISSLTLKALADHSTSTNVVQQKSRVCGHCKRGMRHSSSCSSSTASDGDGACGGANANGSGMTMDELRAVNRYAESTKSLSYLPQVHERQTERMRTRSEWFLGPQDGDLLCAQPNSCGNCYLSAVNLQTTGYYSGGGSTRDMRRMYQSTNSSSTTTEQQVHEAVNTSLYLYYEQEPPPTQRQIFHMFPQHMDTDESFSYYGGGSKLNKKTATIHSMQHQLILSNQSGQKLNPRQDQKAQGLFLDTNYGRYDFDEKDILITNSTDNNNFTYNINMNMNNNNNKHNKENNNTYTPSNCPHLRDTTLHATDSFARSKETTLYIRQTTPLSSSHRHLHAISIPQNYHHRPNILHYYSTESLQNSEKLINVFDEDDKKEEGISSSSSIVPEKLSYHSPRQQKRDEQDLHLLHYHNISDEISPLNATNANIVATVKANTATLAASTTTTSNDCLSKDIEEVDYIVTSHYRHSTPMLHRRRLRQQPLRRQRLPSTSSSLYQSFNASLQAPMSSAVRFNASSFQNSINSDSNLETHSSTVSNGGGGSGGNSNFVSIIFNVLDFLF